MSLSTTIKEVLRGLSDDCTTHSSREAFVWHFTFLTPKWINCQRFHGFAEKPLTHGAELAVSPAALSKGEQGETSLKKKKKKAENHIFARYDSHNRPQQARSTSGRRVPASYSEHARHAGRGGQVCGLGAAALCPVCRTLIALIAAERRRGPAGAGAPLGAAGAAGSRPLLLSRNMQMRRGGEPMRGAASRRRRARAPAGGADLAPRPAPGPSPHLSTRGEDGGGGGRRGAGAARAALTGHRVRRGASPEGAPRAPRAAGSWHSPPRGAGEGGTEGGGAAGEPGREGQREGQRGRVNRSRRDEGPRRAALGAAAAARAGGQGKEGWRPAAGARRAGGGCAGGSPRSWRSAAGRPTPCSRCSPTAGWWRGRSWAASRRRTPATTAW